jgi:hypothetical protein
VVGRAHLERYRRVRIERLVHLGEKPDRADGADNRRLAGLARKNGRTVGYVTRR